MTNYHGGETLILNRLFSQIAKWGDSESDLGSSYQANNHFTNAQIASSWFPSNTFTAKQNVQYRPPPKNDNSVSGVDRAMKWLYMVG
ncbi:unnamed protein product [Medioppia subpectinata]|uniref:Uncharacterized protein n=1 Tax=Medioppia subpectinata TaxID=1979941 RepID=A0A7R9KSC0_9ACAR|nr:unnamed protein product [Medioppia subpectinata]CAG2107557.1 unnamed protein product [Medioppia subpectinata]